MTSKMYLSRGAPSPLAPYLPEATATTAGCLRCLLLLLIGLMGLAPPAASAELLMFRRTGCPYCQAWDQSIGPIYPRSDLGRDLPLRMVDLDQDPVPPVALARGVRYTPTFILAENGREVGRIEGYPGDEFFWGLLERLTKMLPPRS